ncbi:uncharacterized protein LOC134842280 [Symsagittifera roscoffensis]|uniref:uncharacterized protein LOC134842280 n=1 Tax=Symsagittifera roscoffensis TaxID=84072 RepID=UPI00307B2CF4
MLGARSLLQSNTRLKASTTYLNIEPERGESSSASRPRINRKYFAYRKNDAKCPKKYASSECLSSTPSRQTTTQEEDDCNQSASSSETDSELAYNSENENWLRNENDKFLFDRNINLSKTPTNQNTGFEQTNAPNMYSARTKNLVKTEKTNLGGVFSKKFWKSSERPESNQSFLTQTNTFETVCSRRPEGRLFNAHLLQFNSQNPKSKKIARLKPLLDSNDHSNNPNSVSQINSSRIMHNSENRSANRAEDLGLSTLEICQSSPDNVLSFPTTSIEIPQTIEVPAYCLSPNSATDDSHKLRQLRSDSRQFTWTTSSSTTTAVSTRSGTKCRLKRQPMIKLTKKDVEHIRVSWN